MGLLDDAIAATPKARSGPTMMLDRVLATLDGFDDLDRLLDMLAAPAEKWGHGQVAGILRHICDELGVDHEDVKANNVGEWRRREWRRGGS